MEIDFAAEGLLDGRSGEAREGRRRLLEELAADGVSLEELRRSVAEDRLALLPVERLIGGVGPRYTADQVTELSGLEPQGLRLLRQAIGLPAPEHNRVAYTEADLEAARRIMAMMDAGLPIDELLEVTRTMAVAMDQIAAASRAAVISVVVHTGDTELDVAHRFREAVLKLAPMMGPTLQYIFDVHLLEQMRSDVLGSSQISAGRPAASEEISVCFADLVGFTRFGERLDPEHLGALVGRLGELAGEVAMAPVRLVKMIGDAAMLVSSDPAALVDAALALVESADREPREFPQLRAGMARGAAVPRAGDWYGRPVNLASRITAVAYPSSVLASEEVREAAGERFLGSAAGPKRLKGFERPVELFRPRRRE
ncbi:MAG: adenylate cyclase regulatory domain-containing protein [Solirubrobacterales bacterium]